MRRRASPGPLGALGITSGDGADDAAGTGTSTGTSARPGTGTGTGTGTTTDPQGTHEILSLLHGEPAFSPWPPPLQSLAGIRELASWLGDYHRAVRDFRPPADALWQGQEEEWRLGMVIRHGDLGPWNSIWNGDRLAGFIDWDFAAPGHALDDLAQLAWRRAPASRRPAAQSGDRRERHSETAARRPGAAYGAYPAAVLDALDALQTREAARIERLGRRGQEPWGTFLARGDATEMLAEQCWLRSKRTVLLGGPVS